MLSDLFQGFAEFFCATFCNFTAKIPKMSEHSLKRQLKVLTVPVFIEIALVMMLGAVDTVMLVGGKFSVLSRYVQGHQRQQRCCRRS